MSAKNYTLVSFFSLAAKKVLRLIMATILIIMVWEFISFP